MFKRNRPVQPSEATKRAFRQQLREHGKRSLEKSERSLQKQLKQHRRKLEKYRDEGGYVSSVQREIRTFRGQISAIQEILEEAEK